jgi:hypothetical protein
MKPCDEVCLVITGDGAVSIETMDGVIKVTPEMARELAHHLGDVADRAEMMVGAGQ